MKVDLIGLKFKVYIIIKKIFMTTQDSSTLRAPLLEENEHHLSVSHIYKLRAENLK
jgi:hypothetical protein